MSAPPPVQLIYDAAAIERFEAEIARPTVATLGPHRRPALMINLFCRSKYEREQDRDKPALRGLLVQDLYTEKSHLARTISRWQHARPYQLDDRDVPNDMLVVYMNLNPRDQIEPLLELHKSVMSAVLTGGAIPERLDRALVREIHRGKQTRQWVEIDIDTKDCDRIRDWYDFALSLIGGLGRVAFVIETRGGYHLVYRKGDMPQDMFQTCSHARFMYTERNREGHMCTKKYFDIRGDVCVPVPGTLQGGYPVRMITMDEFEQRLA